MENSSEKKQWLGTKEAADMLGVCERRVLTLIYKGRLQATKVGNRFWAIDISDLYAVKDRKTGRPRKAEG